MILTLELSADAETRLNALKLKTEATSYAEVVANALHLYEALIKETEDGKQFLTRDKSGTVALFRVWLP